MSNTNNTARVQVTIEAAALKDLHLVRRNVPGTKGLMQLTLNGVVVGEAKATHVSSSQRYWDAKLSADINGTPVDLELGHVFSAVRLAGAFVGAIQHALSNGEMGATLEQARSSDARLALFKAPKPEAAPEAPATEGNTNEGEKQPEGEAPAAEEKPSRKGGKNKEADKK